MTNAWVDNLRAHANAVAGAQAMLGRLAPGEQRKAFLMNLWEQGALTDDETTLLVQHNELETA